MGLLTKILITSAIRSAADITCSVANVACSVADMKRSANEKEAAYARAAASNNARSQSQNKSQTTDRLYDLDFFYAKVALIAYVANADNVISQEEKSEFNQMLAAAGNLYGSDAITRAREIFNSDFNSFIALEPYLQKVQVKDLDSLIFYADNYALADNRMAYEEKQALEKLRSYVESRKGKKSYVNLVCPGCGGNMRPDSYGYKAICEFCGRETIINADNSPHKSGADVSCGSCGQSLMAFNNPKGFVYCPYCGGSVNKSEKTYKQQVINTNEPNLYITFNTVNPKVGMVTRLVNTGMKNTYINGQTLSFHVGQGYHTIIIKIGAKNYSRNFVIPADNSPVRIYASYNGRAQIAIDQPPV